MLDGLKRSTAIVLVIALYGCSNLYRAQEKICLNTKAHSFSKIKITACGQFFPLQEISDKIWSTKGTINIGNCEVINILGISDAGENIEISKRYYEAFFGKGVRTSRYDIVDLNAEKPWERIKITGYVKDRDLPCDADMPLPDFLKKQPASLVRPVGHTPMMAIASG